jgi:hypothetical protein
VEGELGQMDLHYQRRLSAITQSNMSLSDNTSKQAQELLND